MYIKHHLSQFVSDVETETVMTGMLGLMVRVCSVGWRGIEVGEGV